MTPQDWFDHGAAVGEPDAADNLLTACRICNSRKRDMDLEVFALYLRKRFGQDTRPLVLRVRAALRRALPEDE